MRLTYSQPSRTQAEQEADQAEEIYKVIDEQLRIDLPQILDLRVPYLDPSFECMVGRLLPCPALWA